MADAYDDMPSDPYPDWQATEWLNRRMSLSPEQRSEAYSNPIVRSELSRDREQQQSYDWAGEAQRVGGTIPVTGTAGYDYQSAPQNAPAESMAGRSPQLNISAYAPSMGNPPAGGMPPPYGGTPPPATGPQIINDGRSGFYHSPGDPENVQTATPEMQRAINAANRRGVPIDTGELQKLLTPQAQRALQNEEAEAMFTRLNGGQPMSETQRQYANELRTQKDRLERQWREGQTERPAAWRSV